MRVCAVFRLSFLGNELHEKKIHGIFGLIALSALHACRLFLPLWVAENDDNRQPKLSTKNKSQKYYYKTELERNVETSELKFHR